MRYFATMSKIINLKKLDEKVERAKGECSIGKKFQGTISPARPVRKANLEIAPKEKSPTLHPSPKKGDQA